MEWPSPNGNLYNTRVAHATISSANVAQLKIAWTIPLRGKGLTGADVANPVIANGIAYLQDGASNVMAVRIASGQVLWKHQYNSPDYGPNGVTIANGRIYGVTQSGVFALDAQTGQQDWYDTQLAANSLDLFSILYLGDRVIFEREFVWDCRPNFASASHNAGH